jgi:hypothetical protein
MSGGRVVGGRIGVNDEDGLGRVCVVVAEERGDLRDVAFGLLGVREVGAVLEDAKVRVGSREVADSRGRLGLERNRSTVSRSATSQAAEGPEAETAARSAHRISSSVATASNPDPHVEGVSGPASAVPCRISLSTRSGWATVYSAARSPPKEMPRRATRGSSRC